VAENSGKKVGKDQTGSIPAFFFTEAQLNLSRTQLLFKVPISFVFFRITSFHCNLWKFKRDLLQCLLFLTRNQYWAEVVALVGLETNAVF
jgi:hypothetical protein